MNNPVLQFLIAVAEFMAVFYAVGFFGLGISWVFNTISDWRLMRRQGKLHA